MLIGFVIVAAVWLGFAIGFVVCAMFSLKEDK